MNIVYLYFCLQAIRATGGALLGGAIFAKARVQHMLSIHWARTQLRSATSRGLEWSHVQEYR